MPRVFHLCARADDGSPRLPSSAPARAAQPTEVARRGSHPCARVTPIPCRQHPCQLVRVAHEVIYVPVGRFIRWHSRRQVQQVGHGRRRCGDEARVARRQAKVDTQMAPGCLTGIRGARVEERTPAMRFDVQAACWMARDQKVGGSPLSMSMHLASSLSSRFERSTSPLKEAR